MSYQTAQFDLPDGRAFSAHLVTDEAAQTATLTIAIAEEVVTLDARDRATVTQLRAVVSVISAADSAGSRFGYTPTPGDTAERGRAATHRTGIFGGRR